MNVPRIRFSFLGRERAEREYARWISKTFPVQHVSREAEQIARRLIEKALLCVPSVRLYDARKRAKKVSP